MIDTKNWQEFRIGDLFDVIIAKSQDFGNLDSGNFRFVGRTSDNNGVQGYVDSDCITSGNCITVSMVGTNVALWQDDDFVASQNIAVLRNQSLSVFSAMFICTLLNFDMVVKYSYGRTVSKDKLENTVVKLPAVVQATVDGHKYTPDWAYMEQFMRQLSHKPITTQIQSPHLPLETEKWGEFRIGDLFDVKKGKRLTADDQTEGLTPYVGAIDSNNGVSNMIGQPAIHDGNTISLSYNGSVGEAFYQPNPYWATDDVNALYFKDDNDYEFNPYVGLFVCALLRQEKYRFSYGRKWVLTEMENAVIKFPLTQTGKPDWQWIENYMKSLPYSDRIGGGSV